MSFTIYGIPTGELIKRVSRSYRKLFRPFRRMVNWVFGTKYYDFFLARKMRETLGVVEFGPNIVIYLIFPISGVLNSHKFALEYFRSKGFTPIVVSNLGLEPDGMKALLPLSYKIIERPNYGYDFGGYRDGILSISDELPKLNRIIIMNDSCWFPISAEFDWIDQIDALGVDFAGATSHEALPKLKAADYEKLDWDVKTERNGFHYGSFALNFGERILKDPAFLTYWRRFRVTNDKMSTIERGERGTTRWVKAHGYTHDATIDMSVLYEKINSLSPSETFRVLSDSILVFVPKAPALKRDLLLEYDYSEAWANKAKLFILNCVANQSFAFTLPGYGISDLSFPFLKKSPVTLDEQASNRIMKIAKSLHTSNGKIIAQEVNDLRSVHTPLTARR